jgi:hypothetical protein
MVKRERIVNLIESLLWAMKTARVCLTNRKLPRRGLGSHELHFHGYADDSDSKGVEVFGR